MMKLLQYHSFNFRGEAPILLHTIDKKNPAGWRDEATGLVKTSFFNR